MVQRALQLATEESDDPDLRDRGFVYWRLLSTNPEAAKAVVLSEKPNIADDTFTLEPSVLDMLIGQASAGSGKELDIFVILDRNSIVFFFFFCFSLYWSTINVKT